MTIAFLGTDLIKNSCSLVGLDAAGRVMLRRRTRCESVVAFGAKLPSFMVAMEACCGAQQMGRALMEHGHTIRLMSPDYVHPFSEHRKRRPPRQGRRRGRNTPDDEIRCAQVRGAAQHSDFVPRATNSSGSARH